MRNNKVANPIKILICMAFVSLPERVHLKIERNSHDLETTIHDGVGLNCCIK